MRENHFDNRNIIFGYEISRTRRHICHGSNTVSVQLFVRGANWRKQLLHSAATASDDYDDDKDVYATT